MTAAGDGVAVLLMAYGTPRHADKIEAYYTDIRRGRPPTPELLADLVRRYDAIGGLSPLLARTEAQRARLQQALDERAPETFVVTLGMKHAHPSIEDAVADLIGSGFPRAVTLVLAPHYSAFSVGQYVERAVAAAGDDLEVLPITDWHLEPAYLDSLAAAVRSGSPPARSQQGAVHRAQPAAADHHDRRPLRRPTAGDGGRRRRARRAGPVGNVERGLAVGGAYTRAVDRARHPHRHRRPRRRRRVDRRARLCVWVRRRPPRSAYDLDIEPAGAGRPAAGTAPALNDDPAAPAPAADRVNQRDADGSSSSAVDHRFGGAGANGTRAAWR
jgi:hypothetical protein